MARLLAGLAALVVLIGLYVASLYSFLLFHSLAEGFSIVIACGIFLVAWNTRRYITNHYLLFLGIAYLFVGILDLAHTLAYKGMGVLPAHGANAPTQLWIAARYLQSLSLLAAPLLLRRKIRPEFYVAGYGAVTVLLLLAIFAWRIFPDCFLEDAGGLTPFKIASEYVISAILLLAGGLVWHHRDEFDRQVLRWLLLSILLTVLSELAFTAYVSVYDFANLLGHYLKIVSLYFLYLAIINTGLTRPYDLLFRDLNRHREWLRVTLESIGDAVIATDAAGRITFLNRMAEGLTGWSRVEATGVPVGNVFRILDEHTRATLDDPAGRVLQGGRTACPAHHTLLIRRDGSEVPIDDTAAPIKSQDGSTVGVVLIFRDISERRQAEREQERTAKEIRRLNAGLEERVRRRTAELEHRARQLQKLTLELSQAENRERRRLAQILHNDLQQQLTGAKFHLSVLANRLKEDARSHGLATAIDSMITEAIDQSRSLSHELSPAILYHGDLVDAFRWLAGRMQSQHGLTVEVVGAEVALASEPLKAFLYQAAQELLFNAVKHAGVRAGRIRLRRWGRYVCVAVSDRGRGFDPGTLGDSAGFGLLSIRERVELLGGRMTIRSAPGAGSRFLLTVPDGHGHLVQDTRQGRAHRKG
jgi:PAS domain S-box-containing protein